MSKYSDDYYTQQTIDNDNVAAQLLESSINFLLAPIPIFEYRLPIVIPVASLLAFTVIPSVTWVLSTVFFCIYFFLGNALIGGDSDDVGSIIEGNDIQNNVKEFDEEEDNEYTEIILPLGAYAGAIASAALLSPQGLVMENDSILSFASPFVAISFGLGLVLLMQVKELGNEEQKLEMKERQDGVIRNEKSRMDSWDDELDEMSG